MAFEILPKISSIHQMPIYQTVPITRKKKLVETVYVPQYFLSNWAQYAIAYLIVSEHPARIYIAKMPLAEPIPIYCIQFGQK